MHIWEEILSIVNSMLNNSCSLIHSSEYNDTKGNKNKDMNMYFLKYIENKNQRIPDPSYLDLRNEFESVTKHIIGGTWNFLETLWQG